MMQASDARRHLRVFGLEAGRAGMRSFAASRGLGWLQLAVLAGSMSIGARVIAQAAEVIQAEPKPLIRIAPDFPINAWNNETSGRVEARVTVDEGGRVTHVAIVSENPVGWGFGESSHAALKEWVYPKNRPGVYPAKLKFEWRQVELTEAEKRLPKAQPPVSVVAPDYPGKAEGRSVSGEAIVVMIHDETGVVTNVRISSENPAGYGFGEAVSRAIRQWRFKPGSPGVKSLLIRFHIRL